MLLFACGTDGPAAPAGVDLQGHLDVRQDTPAQNETRMDETPPVEATTQDAVVPEIPFPLGLHDASQIVLTGSGTLEAGGEEWRWDVYENPAYRCGRSGFFTFLVLEREADVSQERPLWLFLRGGGVGYYFPDGAYLGSEDANDMMNAGVLLGSLTAQAVDPAGNYMNTVAGQRMEEGWRLAAVSMCDHDLHSGLGTPYPHNPHHGGEGDTVDGLMANLAAVDLILRGNDGLSPYPSSLLFLHGESAGSAGTWSLAYGLHRQGVAVAGAILDSYTVTERQLSLYGKGCTPLEMIEGFTIDGLNEKIGLMFTEPAVFVENVVASGFPVPLFDLVSEMDYHCCGFVGPLPEAIAAGYDGNCAWARGVLHDAMDARPSGEHHAHLVIEDSTVHVLSLKEGPVQEALEAWVQQILNASPPRPIGTDAQ